MFEPDALLLPFSCLHGLLARQGLDYQAHQEALFMLGIPNPHLPLCHSCIALMLDQPFEIDLLAIFPFETHLMVTRTMHSKGSKGQSLLDTCSYLVPGI